MTPEQIQNDAYFRVNEWVEYLGLYLSPNPVLRRQSKENYLKILNVVGARPNFMKMAPIIKAMNRYPDQIEHLLGHTGQHYDEQMSRTFFDDLGMPKPDIDLGVGSGSHAEQTGQVMVKFEQVCLEEKPD